MRQLRFRDSDGDVRLGELADGEVTAFPKQASRLDSTATFAREDVETLPPCRPSKVVCVGRNYADHAEEMGSDVPDRPLFFLKPPNAVASDGDDLTLPSGKDRLDYEAEIAVVIGERASDLDESEAMDHVAGFTCMNDVSNRDDQRAEQNWIRGKAFDDSAPLGPVLATPDEVPADARLRCRVNGELRQDATREQFIFSVPELLADITRYVTLEPGDVLSTGTPEGVGRLEDGDRVEIELEGVGTLSNTVTIP